MKNTGHLCGAGHFLLRHFRLCVAYLSVVVLGLLDSAFISHAADKDDAPDFISTNLGYVVRQQDISGIPKKKWPDLSPPKELATVFNEATYSRVWLIGGVHFCAIDAGEFGGCLAIGDNRKRAWIPLIEGNINGLFQLSENSFVVTGGVAHLAHVAGHVYLVVRDPAKGWIARQLFESETAVPEICGTTTSMRHKKGSGKRLVVFRFSKPENQTTVPGYFGVDDMGVVQYLGTPR